MTCELSLSKKPGCHHVCSRAEQLAKEFKTTDSTVEAMTVSLYVFGFAFGRLLLAPLSELYGRLILYHLCNTVYFAFTLSAPTSPCSWSFDLYVDVPHQVLRVLEVVRLPMSHLPRNEERRWRYSPWAQSQDPYVIIPQRSALAVPMQTKGFGA